MKTIERIFEAFDFEVLSETEMNEVRGGVDSRPRTRDKDVFDDDTQTA